MRASFIPARSLVRILVLVLAQAVGSTALAPSASAQEPNARQAGRDREILRRVQEAQKQAEDARTRAESEKAAVEGQLAEVQKKAKAVEAGVAQERRRAVDLQQKLDAMTRDHASADAERKALAEKLRQAREQIEQATTELARRQDALTARASEVASLQASGRQGAAALTTCEEKNAALAGVATELMDKYRDVGFWDALRRREPFTRVRRVEVENLLEDYRDRVEASRIPPAR
jgi:chromosome segregation ATPase